MYQLDGRDVIFDWLSQETDVALRETMLEWLSVFCADPLAEAARVPEIRAPVYVVATPVRRVALRFLLAEQFNAIKLIEFVELP